MTMEDKVRDRQAFDYEVPVIQEPIGGPIPTHEPFEEARK